MGNHGAAARPDPGRCFSTILTSVPGAASQEQRLQHAPGLQCALAHSWHSSHCPSRAADAQPKLLLCSSPWENRGILSTGLDLKDKHQNFTAKISHFLPKSRRGASRGAAHTPPCALGVGAPSGCALLMKPQRWPSLAHSRLGNPGQLCGLLCRRGRRHQHCQQSTRVSVMLSSEASKDLLCRNLHWVFLHIFMVLILQLLQFAGFLMDSLPRNLQKPEQQLLPWLLLDDVEFVVVSESS